MSQPDLQHTPAMILQRILVIPSAALFSDPPTLTPCPLYIATLPDDPDLAACVYDTEGVMLARLLASGNELQKFGIQLRLRSRDYQAAFRTTQLAANEISAVKNQTVVLDSISYHVQSIMQTSPVLAIGQDQKRRDEFTLNLLMFIGGF